MIYYNEEKGGWAFDQVTDLEKEKILDLGIQTLMPAIGAEVVKQIMNQAYDNESLLSEFPQESMFNA